MKFYGVPVEDREMVGNYTLLHYRWPGDRVQPGRFVMARSNGYPINLDPLLARPFSFYDHDGEVASLLFEVRGRGTALLDQAARIEVSAPLGQGFEIDAARGRVALLGGGVGVAVRSSTPLSTSRATRWSTPAAQTRCWPPSSGPSARGASASSP